MASTIYGYDAVHKFCCSLLNTRVSKCGTDNCITLISDFRVICRWQNET